MMDHPRANPSCGHEPHTEAEPSAQWARDLLARHNAGGRVIVGSAGSVFINQKVAVAALVEMAAQLGWRPQ